MITHITLLGANLVINTPGAETPIDETLLRADLSNQTAVRQTVTVVSARAGTTLGTKCSADGVNWHVLTVPVSIASIGAKGTPHVGGSINYDAIPVACQTDVLIRAVVAGGNAGNFELSNIAVEAKQ